MNNKILISIYINLFLIFGIHIQSKEQRNLSITLDFTHQDSLKNKSVSGFKLYNLIKSKSTLILTNHVSWACLKLYLIEKKIDLPLLIQDFDIYEDNDFLLFIPHEYKKENPNLGIKLDNFKLIKPDTNYDKSVSDISKQVLFKVYYAVFPYGVAIKSKQLINVLKNLLVPTNESNDIEWNIFFSGHGNSIYITVGITEDEFVEMLSLFQNHVNTRTFYYSSCFAGGKISDFLFTKNGNQLRYEFPIFCVGITDMPTYAFAEFDFKSFFDLIKSIKNEDPSSYINFLSKTFEQYFDNALNIISVRYPNDEFFTIPNIAGKVFVISDSTSSEELNNLPYTTNIVINTPIIKNEINIKCDNQKVPQFISASKGSYVNYIEKINAPNVPYPDLFKSFVPSCASYLSTSKILLIKEINCTGYQKDTDDKLVLNKVSDSNNLKLENVIILLNSTKPWSAPAKDHEIFFVINDNSKKVGYCSNLSGISVFNFFKYYDIRTREIPKKLTKQYLNFFNITKSNLDNGIHRIRFTEKHIDNKPIYRKYYPFIITGNVILTIADLFLFKIL